MWLEALKLQQYWDGRSQNTNKMSALLSLKEFYSIFLYEKNAIVLNRLPREVVESLEVFKSCADLALGDMV